MSAIYHGDFWDDDVILNPYPMYEELRALGPVVWLSRHQLWALTHYHAVRDALTTPSIFSSAHGCMANELMNDNSKGVMLCSDDPEHLQMRRVFNRPLLPRELSKLQERFRALAKRTVDNLLENKSFDAVTELAYILPLSIVTELVGLSEEGRNNMLMWAAGIFNAFGPIDNARTVEGLEIAVSVLDYTMERLDRSSLVDGGWGQALFLAADKGEITETMAKSMLMDYLTPALDTTINATSSAIALFADNPVEWQKLRRDPSLITNAINEVVRLESPIRAFTRYVVADKKIGDVTLRKGDRALMLYACANRDETYFQHADQFIIDRQPCDHLGFGKGIHMCAGQHLARLEITCLLQELIPRVESFSVLRAERQPHNTLRGFSRLDVEVEVA